MERQTGEILDVFGDAYMNRHWVFAMTEVIVCRLFPELMEDGGGDDAGGARKGKGKGLGVSILLEERLG